MLFVLFVLSMATSLARAEERPLILALISPESARTVARLRAELTVAGFDLRLAQPPHWPPTRGEIEQLARAQGAAAALALIPHAPKGVTEIWVVDRVTDKTLLRVFAPTDGQGDQADLLAISAVETLRAALMEINLPHPARGEIPASAAARALVMTERNRFAARAAAAVGYSGGPLGPAAALGLAVTGALRPWLRLGVDGALPVVDGEVTGPEGRAAVRLWLAGAFAEASLTNPMARADLSVAAGLWVAALQMRGVAAAPYLGRTAAVTTLAPHVDVAARLRLARRLAVGARLSAAVAAPEAIVRLAGRDAAHWGRPFVLGALVFEVRLD